MNRLIFFVVVALSLTIISCKNDRLTIDVSNVNNPTKILHYDRDLFSIPVHQLEEQLPSIADQYELFLGKDYLQPANLELLKSYVNKKQNQDLHNDISEVFGDYSKLDFEINNALKHYYHYYPNDSLPPIYTYISELLYEQPIIIRPEGVLIGVDLFTGRNDEAFKYFKVPQFVSKRFQPKYLPAVLVRNMTKIKFRDFLTGETMLENMIAHGKIEYFVKALLPEQHDSIRFIYTPTQMNWCYSREGAFWKHLTSSEYIFSKDYHDFKKYIEDRPFASSLERDSPGRAGVYIGFKIVEEYMKNNPDITVQQLMFETDFNKIFRGSKYNPD